jgi:hypothetical protein
MGLLERELASSAKLVTIWKTSRPCGLDASRIPWKLVTATEPLVEEPQP